VSHHFDSAADRADGRINPCDLYAFPGAPGTTAARPPGMALQARPRGRAAPGNAFAGRDVTAIALQLPDADLGGTRISLWARISLNDHIPPRQVNRIGQAMFRPLFFNPPDSEAGLNALNAAPPAADRDTYSEQSAASPALLPAWPGCPTRTATRRGWQRRSCRTC